MPSWTERFLVLDTETTGTDVKQDRVVELGAVLFEAGTPRVLLDERVNPQRPIPPEASKVHGIYNKDVRDKEPFVGIAPLLVAHLRGHGHSSPPVLVGYNAVAFDVPLLNLELQRAGVPYRINPDQVIDVLTFARWHLRHQRRRLWDLCHAFDVPLAQAHSASADAMATGQLLLRLRERGLLPRALKEALAVQASIARCLESEWDRWQFYLYLDRQDRRRLRMGFGKHCGRLIEEVDARYFAWALNEMKDLPEEVRSVFAARAQDRSVPPS